jgi:undecaprenyl diphosphate synthase
LSAPPASDIQEDAGRRKPSAKYAPLPAPVLPLPRHIAFIMDGNGRWAKRQGLLRLKGHERGAESLRQVTRYCARIGVAEVTFYALSTENYRRRPRAEVQYLMKLLKDYLIEERDELAEGNIRLAAIGRTGELPPAVQEALARTMALSAANTGMVLRLALNYGSRDEILEACRALCREAARGELGPAAIEALSEEEFRRRLQDPGMSDPDLVVRTAGELRLSNFLLWQASYAEIVVIDTLWPDFRPEHLVGALEDFAGRRRKFGGIEAADAAGLEDGAEGRERF